MMNTMIEELSMNAWPSLTTDYHDGWLLRYSNRYTKRANSVYPLYGGFGNLKEKVAFCEAYYDKLHMPATFKIHDGENLHELDIFLEDSGYHVLTPTDVLVMDNLENNPVPSREYRLALGYSEEWADWYGDCVLSNPSNQGSILARQTLKTMLQKISPKSFYVFMEEAGQVIAAGNGVVEAGWLGIYNLVVLPDYRGQGNGKALMEALLVEGKKLGADKSYLQVICNNEAAVALYTGMGYKKAYRYWYRRKES